MWLAEGKCIVLKYILRLTSEICRKIVLILEKSAICNSLYGCRHILMVLRKGFLFFASLAKFLHNAIGVKGSHVGYMVIAITYYTMFGRAEIFKVEHEEAIILKYWTRWIFRIPQVFFIRHSPSGSAFLTMAMNTK